MLGCWSLKTAAIVAVVAISYGAWTATTSPITVDLRIVVAGIVLTRIAALSNADFEDTTMTGKYIMEAIPPYCKEVVQRVRVIEWLGDRVMLEQLDKPWFRIDASLSSFQPDLSTDETTKG